MFRHDWRTLAKLPPDRWIGALFSSDLSWRGDGGDRDTLASTGFQDPRAAVTGTTNEWGDHVGHTLALAAPAAPCSLLPCRSTRPPSQIRDGYGTRLIVGFVRWAARERYPRDRRAANRVRRFADRRTTTVAAIRAVYLDNGAAFLELPNRSLYPRIAFFDTPAHLNEPWQILHSRAVAAALSDMLPPRPSTRITAAAR